MVKERVPHGWARLLVGSIAVCSGKAPPGLAKSLDSVTLSTLVDCGRLDKAVETTIPRCGVTHANAAISPLTVGG